MFSCSTFPDALAKVSKVVTAYIVPHKSQISTDNAVTVGNRWVSFSGLSNAIYFLLFLACKYFRALEFGVFQRDIVSLSL